MYYILSFKIKKNHKKSKKKQYYQNMRLSNQALFWVLLNVCSFFSVLSQTITTTTTTTTYPSYSWWEITWEDPWRPSSSKDPWRQTTTELSSTTTESWWQITTTTEPWWQMTTTTEQWWQATSTTADIGCIRPRFQSKINGNAFATFENVDVSICCELCQKIPECVVSSWMPKTYNKVSVCNLFNNVVNIVYDKNTSSRTMFSSLSPFKCNMVEDRLFYQLNWTEIDNVNTIEECMEECTFDEKCKSWMFMRNTGSCLKSMFDFDNTKSTSFARVTTGTCSI